MLFKHTKGKYVFWYFDARYTKTTKLHVIWLVGFGHTLLIMFPRKHQ